MVNGEPNPQEQKSEQPAPQPSQSNVLQFPGGYRQPNQGARFLIWVAVALGVTAMIAFILSIPSEDSGNGTLAAQNSPVSPGAAPTTPPSSASEGPSISDLIAAINRNFTPPVVINNPGEKPVVLTPGMLTGQEQPK